MKDAKSSEVLRIKGEHWAIVNNLHWTPDIIFRENNARAKRENAVENMNILRK